MMNREHWSAAANIRFRFLNGKREDGSGCQRLKGERPVRGSNQKAVSKIVDLSQMVATPTPIKGRNWRGRTQGSASWQNDMFLLRRILQHFATMKITTKGKRLHRWSSFLSCLQHLLQPHRHGETAKTTRGADAIREPHISRKSGSNAISGSEEALLGAREIPTMWRERQDDQHKCLHS